MGSPTAEELNGLREKKSYDDGTVVRVFCMRTTHDSYPSGWAYNLHYGTTEPDPPRTLDDGTIRRYDNSHEATKGHELHLPPEPEPESIEFPGMVALWKRFWSEIPKREFDIQEQ
jgi:hypothetical protein